VALTINQLVNSASLNLNIAASIMKA